MEEIIKENPNYQKINKYYIVNRNSDDYQIARKRRERQLKQKGFESRLDILEDKLNQLIDLLRNKI